MSRARLAALAAMLLGIAAGGVATPAAADIWKRVDRNGITEYTNRPRGTGWVLVLRSRPSAAARAPGAAAHLAARRARYAPLIEAAARRYALEPELVHAVVRAESAYDADAQSHKGAVGLMQLMPETARRYGVHDRRDPAANVRGGVRYLRDLLAQFRNLRLALAAYNAGENAVLRYGNTVPPYPETRAYVEKVIRFYRQRAGAS